MMATAIIGAGNMGSALYKGLQQSIGSDDVYLCDHNEKKLVIAQPNRRFTDTVEATKGTDCVVLAVKPQAFTGLMQDVGHAWSSKLIISIMAGIPLSRLQQLTGSSHLIRSMPNLGAKIQRGVTGWCASADVSDEERKHVESLFAAIGMSIELESEEKIDAFTAIAGSGPAYVFGLAEMLQNAAKRLGLSHGDSANIASEIIAAGSQLLDEGTMSASEWRKAVTSKGGVTEAAIGVLTEKKIAEIFDDALKAGAERSRSLSQS